MAIYTGTERSKIGSEYDHATDATAAFGRVEPLITVQQLKDRYLFGIPLVAALPDPITKKRAEMTEDMLKDAIMRAACSAETEVGAGFHIVETRVTRRMPFDLTMYRSMGFIRMPDSPILKVDEIAVITAEGDNIYTIPPNWIDPANFKRGQISLLPIQPAWISSGGLPGYGYNGSAMLSILSQFNWVPALWQIQCDVGMENGHIPVFVNELVGLIAAMDVLGKLAATYRIASYSTGIDAASQSVSTPGVTLYDAAIERMMREKAMRLGKVKARYYKNFFADNV